MTRKKRLNIPFADEGSQHAQAAVGFLKDVSLARNSRRSVVHAFGSGLARLERVPRLADGKPPWQTRSLFVGFGPDREATGKGIISWK